MEVENLVCVGCDVQHSLVCVLFEGGCCYLSAVNRNGRNLYLY